jgi:leukotriene-A4 hydrolase
MRSLLLASLLTTAVPAAAGTDLHSYAEPDKVVVTALALDLDVSFEKKALEGTAELSLDWKDAAAKQLVLDTRDLAIRKVEAMEAPDRWTEAKHALAARDATLGSKLTIETPKQPARVRITYATSPEASGLQWLTPEQTQGKKHPFMFSQSQAIHARSWVPLQDSPAVRFTYTAHIDVPKGLRAVMSADNDPKATGEGGYTFTMPQKIPSYLLALAAGDLRFASLGKRTGVYAEPGRIDAAAKEFTDTEAMVDATEKLYGPYRWGRYDLLILPPSFPWGGMENPRLTFATPTIIAGDKSLVNLVAHELAHSWSGNLVTNDTWAHVWLNEGFTVYVENRITEAVYGAEQALMDRVIEEHELIEEMKDLEPELQKLLPNIGSRDPDDTFTGVPYQKGAWFLRTLEQRAGREAFDPFIRGWFDGHAFESVTTDDFLAYLDEKLLKAKPEVMPKAELDAWLHETGIPVSALRAKSPRLEAVDAARTKLFAGELDAKDLGAKAWVTQEWLHFLNGIPKDATAEQLAKIDEAWKLTQTGNAEIAMRWFLAGIRAGYEPIRAPLRKYLVEIGRRKLVVPLYEELAKTPENKAFAEAAFAEAKPGYHPVTTKTVSEKLAAKPEPAKPGA